MHGKECTESKPVEINGRRKGSSDHRKVGGTVMDRVVSERVDCGYSLQGMDRDI